MLGKSLAVGSRAHVRVVGAIALAGLTAILATGLVTVSAVVLPAQVATATTAAPGAAFTCATPTTFVSTGMPTQLYASAPAGSPFVQLGTSAVEYNALSFDTENDYIYAIEENGSGDLLQIDSTGHVTNLGAVSGLPTNVNYYSGAFDDSGNYWVATQNASTIYEIDVVASTPVVVSQLNLDAVFAPVDLTFDYGYIWGMNDGLIYRVHLGTGNVGTVDTFPIPPGISPVQLWAAAWTFAGNGNLGFSDELGDITEISVTNPTGTPTFALVTGYNGVADAGDYDGTSCATPTDLGIVKSGPATVAPGGTVSWTLTVTNSGPGNFSAFIVNDDVPVGVTSVTSSTGGCTVTGNDLACLGALVDGGSTTISLTGKAPATAGVCFTNAASVTGDQNDPNPTNNSSSVTTCTGSASIALAKSASITGYSAPGTPVTYSYLVTNTGNLTLNPVTVADPQAGLSAITCPDTSLTGGASETCTATYTTTQADVDNGSISNTGTATGTPPVGANVTAISSLNIPATLSPAIELKKSASITSYSAPGTPVTYSYLVTNTGNVTLTAVGVTDPQAGLSSVACPDSTLAPGNFETCTASYSTTQADVDGGSITNTGTATGTPPSGPAVTDSSSLTISAVQGPAIGIVKSADITGYSAPGTPVTYSYTVTNSGNDTLTDVTITDNELAPSAINCGGGSNVISSLAPTDSVTCTADYTTTQSDVDSGSIANTGTAMGAPPLGQPEAVATSTLTIPATQTPEVSVVKSASITGYSAPGTPITYSYLVSNTGNVTLTSVGVSDPQIGLSAVTCTDATLAPGGSETCTAGYTTTQSDVDAGGITNTGTASGTPPSGSPVTANSTLTIPATQTPQVSVVKSANITGYSAPGVPITYSYAVTNSGNVTLSNVTVTDDVLGSALDCGGTNVIASLAPAATVTCTAAYVTTQSDVDAGAITNTGTATGITTPNDPNVETVTASSTLTIPSTQTPGISLAKSADTMSFAEPGTPIAYSYLVTNTGNVTLSSVGVTDPQDGLSTVSCPDTSLAPAAAETCMATYTTTQSDVDAGAISNTGTAAGTPPGMSPITAISSLTIPASQTSAIGIAKTTNGSNGQDIPEGAPVTWSYSVTNSGNVTLSDVTITDNEVSSSVINCGSGSNVVTSLAPTASVVCTATGTATAGAYSNVGAATGTPPNGGTPVSDTSTGSYFGSNPSIGIVKSASITGYSGPDVPITYSYVVTNTGNVALNSVTVSDPMPGLSAVTCPDASLAPAASETCSAAYTTTQADVDAGHLTNTGTATGTPAVGANVSASSALTIRAHRNPKIALVKSATITSFDTAGTPVTYSYTVTNSGNVTLKPVKVTDAMAGLSVISCPDTSLAPGAVEMCTASYTTTKADVKAGFITNIGKARGTAPSGKTVIATSSVTVPVVYPTTTVLSMSKSSVTYGREAPETFSAVVSSSGGHPTGNVTISSSAGTLCTVGLSAGKGSCNLTAVQLPAGAYSDVVATYAGSGRYAGSSSSPAESFSVTQDMTKTSVSVSPANVTYGDESEAVVTMTVKTHEGEAVPNDETATVRVGSVTCVVTLIGGTGNCEIGAAALAIGSWAVSGTYGGDANLIGSSTTCTKKLTVTRDGDTVRR